MSYILLLAKISQKCLFIETYKCTFATAKAVLLQILKKQLSNNQK